jgi:hypothetical protein
MPPPHRQTPSREAGGHERRTRTILGELTVSAGMVYIPRSWFRKLAQCWRYRPPISDALWPVVTILLEISWANGGGAIELPKKPLDEEPVESIGTLRRLLEISRRAQIPYDGLGSRSIWRRTLLALECHDVLRLTWRKDSVSVTPVFTKEERQLMHKHWRNVMNEKIERGWD